MSVDMVERPKLERVDRWNQRAAKVGQLIIDARRDARGDGAADEAVALEVAQSERQHALRDGGDLAPQLVEAPTAGAERRDDEHGPFVADALEQGR